MHYVCVRVSIMCVSGRGKQKRAWDTLELKPPDVSTGN